jgi:uncharacterized protein (TIGR00369 family)
VKRLAAAELDYVLAGIARSRAPGFNFPGNYLQVAYDRVKKNAATLSLDAGPHCIDRDGQVNLGALALLADMALAASFRESVGRYTRLATVSMNLQFTGAPRTGRLVAEATYDGLVPGLAGEQGLARVEMRSNGRLICTGSGGFMAFLSARHKLAHPMQARSRTWRSPPVPAIEDLTPEEAAIYANAMRALKARDERSFIEGFWGYRPRASKTGASATMPIAPHTGNRIGHAQGGITFGLATTTATAALIGGETGDSWSLVSASAWYVGVGTGKRLRAKSTIVHKGGATAVVHTRIANDEGRGVLECVTSHARAR